MQKWWHCLSWKPVQLPDPAEPRPQKQLRPSTSAHIKNTSMHSLFLALRQASSSLHQASSNQQQVLRRGQTALCSRSVILVSAWCHRPEPYWQHNLNVLVMWTPHLHGCADQRSSPWALPDHGRDAAAGKAAYWASLCCWGIIMIKHQVILSAGTRFFVAVAWVLRHVLCGLVSVLWRNVLGSVNWDHKTHSKTSGKGRNKFYTDNEKRKISDSLIQMVWQQTNIYGARVIRKHTLSIQHNTFRENAGIGKFSLCHIKNSYFTMIIIVI